MYNYLVVFASVLLSVTVQNTSGQNVAQSSAQAQAQVQRYPQNRYITRLYRPCPNFQPSCISQWLSRNSYCRVPSPGVVQEPFYASVNNFELPSINTTLFRYDIRLTNILTGKIEEFFVDYTNGYTVLSIDYTDLTINSGEARYELNRRANIPLVEITPTQLIYPGVAITTVFPSTNGLDLAQSRSTGFLDQLPTFTSLSNGPIEQANVANIQTTSIEAFTTTAPFVNGLFIQNVLCNFGITLPTLT